MTLMIFFMRMRSQFFPSRVEGKYDFFLSKSIVQRWVKYKITKGAA